MWGEATRRDSTRIDSDISMAKSQSISENLCIIFECGRVFRRVSVLGRFERGFVCAPVYVCVRWMRCAMGTIWQCGFYWNTKSTKTRNYIKYLFLYFSLVLFFLVSFNVVTTWKCRHILIDGVKKNNILVCFLCFVWFYAFFFLHHLHFVVCFLVFHLFEAVFVSCRLIWISNMTAGIWLEQITKLTMTNSRRPDLPGDKRKKFCKRFVDRALARPLGPFMDVSSGFGSMNTTDLFGWGRLSHQPQCVFVFGWTTQTGLLDEAFLIWATLTKWITSEVANILAPGFSNKISNLADGMARQKLCDAT